MKGWKSEFVAGIVIKSNCDDNPLLKMLTCVSLHVHMCTCMCVFTSTHMHTHAHTHTNVYTYLHNEIA